LADFLAGITASTRGFQATVARTTIVLFLGVVHLVEVVSEFGGVGVGYQDTVRIKPGFQNVMGYVALKFTADVHHVQTDD
jgi:hypothetical protein